MELSCLIQARFVLTCYKDDVDRCSKAEDLIVEISSSLSTPQKFIRMVKGEGRYEIVHNLFEGVINP